MSQVVVHPGWWLIEERPCKERRRESISANEEDVGVDVVEEGEERDELPKQSESRSFILDCRLTVMKERPRLVAGVEESKRDSRSTVRTNVVHVDVRV